MTVVMRFRDSNEYIRTGTTQGTDPCPTTRRSAATGVPVSAGHRYWVRSARLGRSHHLLADVRGHLLQFGSELLLVDLHPVQVRAPASARCREVNRVLDL